MEACGLFEVEYIHIVFAYFTPVFLGSLVALFLFARIYAVNSIAVTSAVIVIATIAVFPEFTGAITDSVTFFQRNRRYFGGQKSRAC